LATHSKLRRYWLELAWGVFAALNAVAIVLIPSGETIPFHFIWVSLALVYGLRLWSLRKTLALLAGVVGVAGLALGVALSEAGAGWDEASEVPLMALMFVAMIWHVERRQAALRDVQRLAEEKHALHERQRELVRDVSHELRTPITVARGHAELLRTSVNGQSAEDADIVVDELNRLARIADRLLMLAAAEHPGFLKKAEMDLEQLIVETVLRWGGTASRRWSVDVVPNGPLVADEERLQVALDALVENAVKFTSEGQGIVLAARTEAGVSIVEVADEGVGIAPNQVDHVFDRFVRLEHGRSRSNGGTGLGLAIVKAIAEAHGGSAELSSTLGEGTCVSIRLPAESTNGDSGHGNERDPAAFPKAARLLANLH
jgi:two-component system, OmpR family, sensor kinase